MATTTTTRARVELQEWAEKDPKSESALSNVYFEDGSKESELAGKLSRSNMLEITELKNGLYVKAYSYVGRISIGGLEITIQPKLDSFKLMSLIRYAYGLRDLRFYSDVSFSEAENTFLDILINQLINEVNELSSRGLHRRYERKEEELDTIRGRIDIQEIVRQGGIIRSSLPCIYNPRLEDCLPNQVLLAGLSLAARLTTDLRLKTECRRLIALLQESVSLIELNRDTFGKLERQQTRLTKAYEPSWKLIRILYDSKGMTLEDKARTMDVPGFLFDMNSFFQALLSKFLRENLKGYTIEDEHTIRGMMSYVPEYNPNRRQSPNPRPDYVVRSGSSIVSILDAKYRNLWEKPLPSKMLYQLAIYALSQKSPGKASILYPALDTSAREARIKITDAATRAQLGFVNLRPVNLVELEKLVSTKRTPESIKAKQSFAEYLAFGF